MGQNRVFSPKKFTNVRIADRNSQYQTPLPPCAGFGKFRAGGWVPLLAPSLRIPHEKLTEENQTEGWGPSSPHRLCQIAPGTALTSLVSAPKWVISPSLFGYSLTHKVTRVYRMLSPWKLGVENHSDQLLIVRYWEFINKKINSSYNVIEVTVARAWVYPKVLGLNGE